jgi:methylmalonyl-CoA/ethylmalonyl-CoA epimerase
MNEAPEITQVAIVVRDLEAAMEAYHRLLGWGPWQVYDFRPPLYGDLKHHGEPADYGVPRR